MESKELLSGRELLRLIELDKAHKEEVAELKAKVEHLENMVSTLMNGHRSQLETIVRLKKEEAPICSPERFDEDCVCEDCKSHFKAVAEKEVEKPVDPAPSASCTITGKTAKGMANQVKRYLVKRFELNVNYVDVIVRQENSDRWIVIWEGGYFDWAIVGSMGGNIVDIYAGKNGGSVYGGKPTFSFTNEDRVCVEAENSYTMSFQDNG